MKKPIFEVDIAGMRALQAGKPMWFVVRELVQNALDEPITRCDVAMSYERGFAIISVEDDSPEGFKDLSDAYTLFKDTRKRYNTKTRGRFNLGEKQVICMCDTATIVTTTGGVMFDKAGRHLLRKKRPAGSMVSVKLKMSHEDYRNCGDYISEILIPNGIIFTAEIGEINESEIGRKFVIPYTEPYIKFDAGLITEVMRDDAMRREMKNTKVHVHNHIKGRQYLYELGIPVCEIDCEFSLDVQQKVPLNTDRDGVDQKFLRTLYAETLNVVYVEIQPEKSSEAWVRIASAAPNVSSHAINDIFEKRYGEKAVIANPFDKKSIDEAICNGFNVIRSSELNGAELDNARRFNALKTSSEQFPVTVVGYKMAAESTNMKRIAAFAKKVYERFVNKDKELNVMFIVSDASMLADFGAATLRFNCGHSTIDFTWFEMVEQTLSDGRNAALPSSKMVDLIIHELAHEFGTHYEKPYLNAITRIGAELTHAAMFDPGWFVETGKS